jgi:hypothetical protein
MKDPASFTPMRNSNQSLILGSDMKANQASIAQFSQRDAVTYGVYEERMGAICQCLESLLDRAPPRLINASQWSRARQLYDLYKLGVCTTEYAYHVPKQYVHWVSQTLSSCTI